MGLATLSAYGGCGFALDAPTTVVEATAASENAITGGVDDELRGALDTVLAEASGAWGVNTAVHVIGTPDAHVGFGSKTSAVLATLTATALAHGRPINRTGLVTMGKRGGASGIGVNTFFEGGFVCDAGHAQHPERYEPSRRRPSTVVPIPLVRLQVPPSWRVHLVLPQGNRQSGTAEDDFFARSTPIPRAEVLETLALVYHGLAASIARQSLDGVGAALSQLQQVGFKRREIEDQPTPVGDLLAELSAATGGCAGMSSMGPLLFAFVGKSSAQCQARLRGIARKYGAKYLGEHQVPPTGYSFERR